METIIQGRTKGRIRWLWVVALGVVIGLATVTRWFTRPVPPPVVSLSLVGFKSTPTNTYALMCLSNRGPTEFFFDYRYWEGHFRTPEGILTNSEPGPGLSILSLNIEPRSNYLFRVPIPSKATNWQVQATCEYFVKLHVRWEIGKWMMRHQIRSDLIWKPVEVVGPVLEKLFPTPQSGWVSTRTGWMTNLPSANSSSR